MSSEGTIDIKELEKEREKYASSLCADIPDMNVSGRVTVDFRPGEGANTAVGRYISEQADGWCAGGLCSSGECDGQPENISIAIVSSTNTSATADLSFTIKCKCV